MNIELPTETEYVGWNFVKIDGLFSSFLIREVDGKKFLYLEKNIYNIGKIPDDKLICCIDGMSDRAIKTTIRMHIK